MGTAKSRVSELILHLPSSTGTEKRSPNPVWLEHPSCSLLSFCFLKMNFPGWENALASKGYSRRNHAYSSQLQLKPVQRSSCMLMFANVIFVPYSDLLLVTQLQGKPLRLPAPSHPLLLFYVYMLHNYGAVSIYHLFWAVSRKKYNTITSSHCLSQDN